MIKTEYYKTRSDGTRLQRTYSDKYFMIERDGVRYEEAIDPEDFGRIYIETDEPIFASDDPIYMEEVLNILLGEE